MRLLQLDLVAEGAELARDVASGRPDGMPLLRAGTQVSPRLKDALNRAGVHSIYVQDELTEGIEPKPILTDATRARATQAVAQAFEAATSAMENGRPLSSAALAEVDEVAALMGREIDQTGEFALALADLSGPEGYLLHHSVDVAALGLLLGQRIFRERGYVDYRGRQTFDKVDARLTRLGAGLLLHDIGKLALPSEIMDKPGQLDAHEWELVKRHPVAGLEMLSSDLISPLVKAVVRSHHERWDGGGYPDAKAGEDIHELARIAAVADVYDAITSERVHAPARPAHVGVRVVRSAVGSAFDPEVVKAFAGIVAPFPPGAAIELSDGRGGVVASVPQDDIDRPVVRVLGDGDPYDLPLKEHPSVGIQGWDVVDAAASAAS